MELNVIIDEYTHNSTGDGQDTKVDYHQKRLCRSPEVLAVVHVQPEDGRESDCSDKVRINNHIRVEWRGFDLTAEPASE